MKAKPAYRRFIDLVLGPEPGTPEHWKRREALGLNGKLDWKCEDCGFVTTQVFADIHNLPDSPDCEACGSWDVEVVCPDPAVQPVEFHDKWYVRYPCAILCLWGAWYLLNNHPAPAWEALGIWPSITLVIFAAVLARELFKWLLICGVFAAIMNWLAHIPVSLAIIIGAFIIGSYMANGDRR